MDERMPTSQCCQNHALKRPVPPNQIYTDPCLLIQRVVASLWRFQASPKPLMPFALLYIHVRELVERIRLAYNAQFHFLLHLIVSVIVA